MSMCVMKIPNEVYSTPFNALHDAGDAWCYRCLYAFYKQY
jgi:hypothetical protein